MLSSPMSVLAGAFSSCLLKYHSVVMSVFLLLCDVETGIMHFRFRQLAQVYEIATGFEMNPFRIVVARIQSFR